MCWRRKRDSNSRRTQILNGFQDRRDQPLCHFSALCEVISSTRNKSKSTTFFRNKNQQLSISLSKTLTFYLIKTIYLCQYFSNIFPSSLLDFFFTKSNYLLKLFHYILTLCSSIRLMNK